MVTIDREIDARIRDWTGETREAPGSLAKGFCSSSKGIFEGLARCLVGTLDVEKYFGDVEKYEMGKPAEHSGEDSKAAKNNKASKNKGMNVSFAKAVDKEEVIRKLKDKLGKTFPEGLTADKLPDDLAKKILGLGDVNAELKQFIDHFRGESAPSGNN
ncbi:MAG: hypothetical protein BWY40_01132 [bacterium ADurb.Bin270]|nr:hypothetical protein [Myxococcales bacterium]OQA59532.1 MAG: hypothetical protein BWY40_01132 [bacterium ADurb.Bin270]